MPNTTTPNFTALGVKNIKPTFALITSRHTVPDLNPIERVWKLTRKLCIHDQYFPTITAVITVVETQFEKWTNGNVTLRRLCSI
jgi:hypothetical protein